MNCPDCGCSFVDRFEYSSGAVIEDCPECDYWKHTPPDPFVES